MHAERVQRLLALESDLRQDYFKSLQGRTVQAIVESTRGMTGIGQTTDNEWVMRGTSCRFAPVEFFAPQPVQRGTLVSLKVVAATSEKLVGLPV